MRFHQLARTLREQCPWDQEQTHAVAHHVPARGDVRSGRRAARRSTPTIRRPTTALIEELGDLLYQIEFHATIAEQQGRFTIADVAAGHPRQARAPPSARVRRRRRRRRRHGGRQLGRDQARREGAHERVRRRGPVAAVAGYAQHLQRKAAKVGFDWPDVGGALPKIAEEPAELRRRVDERRRATRSPTSSATCCSPSSTSPATSASSRSRFRAAADKFRRRFEGRTARRATGHHHQHADLAVLDALWDEVKLVE